MEKTLSNLFSLIREQAEHSPDKIAVRFLGDRGDVSCLTFAEVDIRARAVAAHLQAIGAEGQRALVLHPPGLDYITALLGCLYAGVVVVPVFPQRFNRGMDRLRDIARDADARFALTTGAALQKIEQYLAIESELLAATWVATDELEDSRADAWMAPPQGLDTIALLQYTSGSTSAPKGVMLSHGNLIANIAAMARKLPVTREDSGVSWLPLYHDMGLIGCILLPLTIGAQSTFLSPSGFLQRPYRWLKAISEYRATVCSAPNFGYELCTRRITPEQTAGLDLSSWRTAFCGAERVRIETVDGFARAFAPAGFRRAAFTPAYGLAEATLAVSFGSIDDSARGALRPGLSLVSCGTPIPECKVLIVDPDAGTVKPDEEVGEIWVSGPSVAQGYWRKPELSHATFAAKPAGTVAKSTRYLRTGDLGFMRKGELYVAGRIKDLIVLRGVNYHAEDLEETLIDCHPRLRLGGAAAFAVDTLGEERLIIAHEVDAIRDAPLDEMVQTIRSRIAAAHEIMVHDVVLLAPGGLPKTSSGKVQRRRCREMYLAGELVPLGAPTRGVEHHAAPPAGLAEAVAALMADLLGMQTLHVSDDFFWLGGHSLLATQLISRIREKFAVDLPLRSVFDDKTPQAIAARIASTPQAPPIPPIEPVERNAELVLSFSQQRLWYLHQLDPASSAYNVSGAALLEGSLDVNALRRAFEAVVARHEVLRTSYPTVDGAPTVVIGTGADFPFAAADLRAAADPAAAATRAASELASEPFNIAAGPLLRVALYRIGEQRYQLCASMHHMVTDAWSFGLLVADMLRYYDAFTAGAVPDIAPVYISYVDYAQWQRRYFTDEYLRGQLNFWKRHLQGASPVVLPSDRPRTLRRSWVGALTPLLLPDELFDSLGSLAVSHGATLFMLMLTAFEILLHRYTGSTDLVVGVPVANRNWRAAESLMGSLVNTLALRLRFDEGVTFAQLLRQVREVSLDAYANQDLPFERLVAELAVERKPGELPLVSVMFDFQNPPMPGRADREPRMSPVMLSRGASQFDLSLLVLDTDFGRSVGVEYNTELFDPGSILRLAVHYRSILESIALHPDVPIEKIPLLGRSEREALLALSCGTNAAVSPLEPIHSSFESQARRSPQAAALTDRHGTVTYAELDLSADSLAIELQALGAAPGERIAVYLQRDRTMVIALLAILKTGAAYVPLDPAHPTARIEYVLEDAEPRIVLTERALLATLRVPPPAVAVCLDEPARASNAIRAAPLSPHAAAASNAVYVIYTSGSTGRPKGVEITSGALANFLHSMRHTPGIGENDRLLAVTTIAFDIAGLELWLPLTSGACVQLATTDTVGDARALMALMQQQRPTIMQATPGMWAMLIDAGWSGGSGLKILCGGEVLPVELSRQLLARGASVWNMYGPTETTIWSALHRVAEADPIPIPIGRPIDQTSIRILDRQRELMPLGVPGEIYIGGAGVANGYFRRPDLTRQRFVPDAFAVTPGMRLYRTGDAGRMRDDGLIQWLGRLDDQIKLRGFRIEPGEIEAVLNQQQGVLNSVVVARGDSPGGQYLVAYYITADGAPLPAPQLLEPLRRVLPAYMVPAAFVALQSFPQTPNGKIARNLLPLPDLGASPVDEHVEPRDDLERTLAKIWSETLGIPRPGIRDDFFSVGGHSLLAVRMFARIEKRLGVVLPLSILHERPTIEYLAEKSRFYGG